MKKNTIYETLCEEQQEELNGIIEAVLENPALKSKDDEELISPEMVMALLELLDNRKKVAKKEMAVAKKQHAPPRQGFLGHIEVGDVISFFMNSKQYEREVLNLSDKTVTVEFTPDYPCESTKPVGKKYIKYTSIAKVVSNEPVAEEQDEDPVLLDVAV
jgi:hypothetical protein